MINKWVKMPPLNQQYQQVFLSTWENTSRTQGQNFQKGDIRDAYIYSHVLLQINFLNSIKPRTALCCCLSLEMSSAELILPLTLVMCSCFSCKRAFFLEMAKRLWGNAERVRITSKPGLCSLQCNYHFVKLVFFPTERPPACAHFI